MTERADSLPIEHFIQALTSQLDRAQETMALKARAGLPLTFAVKDLALELRTHVDVRGDVVRISPAGPGDSEASVLHLGLTTITRPMIEENTAPPEVHRDEPSLKEALGDDITEEEQRRLEWAGIRSVSQLREVGRQSGEAALERVSALPVDRLRAALARASRPMVRSVERDRASTGADAPPLLRIRGMNLADGGDPEVRVGGERAEVLAASDGELLVRAGSPLLAGTLEVRTGDSAVLSDFDVRDGTPADGAAA